MLPRMNRTVPAAILTAATLMLAPACASTPTPAAPAAAPATASPSATSAPATPTTSTLIAVANWWDGGGKAQTTKLTGDMSAIVSADSSPTAMGDACSAFSTDITGAQSYTPIPDGQAQQHWSAALDHFQQAATDCVAATSTMNTDLMNKTTTEITAGSTELEQATARIQAITASG